MADSEKKSRHPMDVDTEPTDEELGIIMREACDLAQERKTQSDQWMREELRKAVLKAKERDLK